MQSPLAICSSVPAPVSYDYYMEGMKELNKGHEEECAAIFDYSYYEEVYGIRKRRPTPLRITNMLKKLDHRYQCGVINIARQKKSNESIGSTLWSNITLEPDKYQERLQMIEKLEQEFVQLRSTICD